MPKNNSRARKEQRRMIAEENEKRPHVNCGTCNERHLKGRCVSTKQDA